MTGSALVSGQLPRQPAISEPLRSRGRSALELLEQADELGCDSPQPLYLPYADTLKPQGHEVSNALVDICSLGAGHGPNRRPRRGILHRNDLSSTRSGATEKVADVARVDERRLKKGVAYRSL